MDISSPKCSPAKVFMHSEQTNLTDSAGLNKSESNFGSRTFLNLISDGGAKFSLVQDTTTTASMDRNRGRERQNSCNWPFRSRSHDRSSRACAAKSVHLPMSESNSSLSALGAGEDQDNDFLFNAIGSPISVVKNAHVRGLQANNYYMAPTNNMSRSISQNFYVASPTESPMNSRHAAPAKFASYNENSPMISRASNIALKSQSPTTFNSSRRSSVSSTKEDYNEPTYGSESNYAMQPARPPLVRRPSWKKQSYVLQKARKFENASQNCETRGSNRALHRTLPWSIKTDTPAASEPIKYPSISLQKTRSSPSIFAMSAKSGIYIEDNYGSPQMPISEPQQINSRLMPEEEVESPSVLRRSKTVQYNSSDGSSKYSTLPRDFTSQQLAVSRGVQSISDLHGPDTENSTQEKSAFFKSRELKESSCSSTTSTETTDEEIVGLTLAKAPTPPKRTSLKRDLINFRNKLSTKAASDSNFNAVQLKRWSDYRASWNQHVNQHQAEETLSKSEQTLHETCPESAETPVPTTVQDITRNGIEEDFLRQVEHAKSVSENGGNHVATWQPMGKNCEKGMMEEESKRRSQAEIERELKRLDELKKEQQRQQELLRERLLMEALKCQEEQLKIKQRQEELIKEQQRQAIALKAEEQRRLQDEQNIRNQQKLVETNRHQELMREKQKLLLRQQSEEELNQLQEQEHLGLRLDMELKRQQQEKQHMQQEENQKRMEQQKQRELIAQKWEEELKIQQAFELKRREEEQKQIEMMREKQSKELELMRKQKEEERLNEQREREKLEYLKRQHEEQQQKLEEQNQMEILRREQMESKKRQEEEKQKFKQENLVEKLQQRLNEQRESERLEQLKHNEEQKKIEPKWREQMEVMKRQEEQQNLMQEKLNEITRKQAELLGRQQMDSLKRQQEEREREEEILREKARQQEQLARIEKFQIQKQREEAHLREVQRLQEMQKEQLKREKLRQERLLQEELYQEKVKKEQELARKRKEEKKLAEFERASKRGQEAISNSTWATKDKSIPMKSNESFDKQTSSKQARHEPVEFSYLEGRTWEITFPLTVLTWQSFQAFESTTQEVFRANFNEVLVSKIYIEDAYEPEVRFRVDIEISQTVTPFNGISRKVIKQHHSNIEPITPFQNKLPHKVECASDRIHPKRVSKPVELKFNDYMISFLPGLCYEILDEENNKFGSPINYNHAKESKQENECTHIAIIIKVKIEECIKWRQIPIIIDSFYEDQIEITEISDGSSDGNDGPNMYRITDKDPDSMIRSVSDQKLSTFNNMEITEIKTDTIKDEEDEDSFEELESDPEPTRFKSGIMPVTMTDEDEESDTKGLAHEDGTFANQTSISEMTMSQESLIESPDFNGEVERAFAGSSIMILDEHLKRDSGNHTQTTEFEATTTDDSDDEFETMRMKRMMEREAAPPERDIFEDDTENADFQLKLRHMNTIPGLEPLVTPHQPLLQDTVTESIETLLDLAEEEIPDLQRSKSQELFDQKQLNKKIHIPPTLAESDLTVDAVVEEELDEDEELEFGDIVSAFPIRQSRSFDSGLPRISPELSKLLPKTRSVRHLSSNNSVHSIRSMSTPSPRKQSIEDLASSVENLKEKLLLIPKDSAETIQAVKERLSRPTTVTGSLTRSRSWQGFSAAHRTSRQQAFWESQRYESTSEKDLSLPPPPDTVPKNLPKVRSSSSSPNRYSSRSSRSRGYRPLSRSPSSSPARHHLRLAQHKEKNAATEEPSKPAKKKKKSTEENNDSGSSSSSDSENDEYRCVVFEEKATSKKSDMTPLASGEGKVETNDDDNDNGAQDSKRLKKADSQAAFHRHQYLSIIQEEEENSEMTTPGSSRASSRPGSIYGFKSLQLSPESPKRSPKRKTDSAESVNSLLSDESSGKTRSSPSKTDVLKEDITMEDSFNKLQKQLSEIEKSVSNAETRKRSKNAAISSANVFGNNLSSNNVGASKFGNSMREMLKSVVTSQKNVLHKKVESIESGKKMGKFFKSPFKSNVLSKSNLSLAKSKDSLNLDLPSNPQPVSVIPKEVKRRSKSCSNETRVPVDAVRPKMESEKSKATRWLGKTPFDNLNEKLSEVQSGDGQQQWLGRGRMAQNKEMLKKKVQHWEKKTVEN